MRIWITGAAGFVGRYTTAALKASGEIVLLTDMRHDPEHDIAALDIRDAEATKVFAQDNCPDACIHLAGVAFVPDAAKNPQALTAINVHGAVNVARALAAANSNAKMLFVSTAQVYGYKYRDAPMTVDDDLRPASPYAESKAQAERMLRTLSEETGLDIRVARPGNHTGPGQSINFVVPSFVASLRAVRDGLCKTITVGNLESERDFTDVRDVVDAYLMILRDGERNDVYNISAGQHLTIGALLGRIMKIANVSAPIEVKAELFRPTDAVPQLCTEKMRALGWHPRYSLDQTIADVWNETTIEQRY